MTSPVPDLDDTATVRRPVWTALPDAVRAAVGEAAGCAVVRADPPPGSGFTGWRDPGRAPSPVTRVGAWH